MDADSWILGSRIQNNCICSCAVSPVIIQTAIVHPQLRTPAGQLVGQTFAPAAENSSFAIISESASLSNWGLKSADGGVLRPLQWWFLHHHALCFSPVPLRTVHRLRQLVLFMPIQYSAFPSG